MSGGPWCISKSGDVLPLECCEIAEEWEGSAADPKASEALSLGLSLLLGNFINGACGFTTCTTLVAEAILLPIVTPEQGQLPAKDWVSTKECNDKLLQDHLKGITCFGEFTMIHTHHGLQS